MLNVGEGLRGKGAPRWFIFLSNRRKKKENTSLYVRLHPRRSQVTPDRAESRCSLKFGRRRLSSCSRQNMNRTNFSAPFRRGCQRSKLFLHSLHLPADRGTNCRARSCACFVHVLLMALCALPVYLRGGMSSRVNTGGGGQGRGQH